MGNPYETGLDRNPANYESLTPLLFIEWSAYVYPERTSVIHGGRRFTWAETYARSRRLASALANRGVGLGDTVALMAANTPEMYEAHFGVPMTGAVLNTLTTRSTRGRVSGSASWITRRLSTSATRTMPGSGRRTNGKRYR